MRGPWRTVEDVELATLSWVHWWNIGLRWIVEATNAWGSNYGHLRRSTDRRERHRHAALRLATAVPIMGRLIDYRNRWSPTPT